MNTDLLTSSPLFPIEKSKSEQFLLEPSLQSTSEKGPAITSVQEYPNSFEKLSSNNIEYNTFLKPELSFSSISSPQAPKRVSSTIAKKKAEEIVDCINQVASNLTPFFVELNEKNTSHIFVLDKEGNKIELQENKIQNDLALESSHEKVKEHFIIQCSLLYGKEVIDTLYPEALRKEPLTLELAHYLLGEINLFQNSVMEACQGDPKKYEASLQAQLATLKQIKQAVSMAFDDKGALGTQVASLQQSLSKQLNLSPEILQAGMIIGIATTALVATASGVALPLGLHAAVTAAFAHLPTVGSAFINTTAASHVATTVGSAMSSITKGTVAVAAGTGASTLAGMAGGGALGMLIYTIQSAISGNRPFFPPSTYILGGTAIGGMAGLSFGFAASLLGPGALHLTSVAHPSTWGLYGGAAGGLLGNLWTVGSIVHRNIHDEPTSLGEINSAADALIAEDEHLRTGEILTQGLLRGDLLDSTQREELITGALPAAAVYGTLAGASALSFGGLCNIAAQVAIQVAAAL